MCGVQGNSLACDMSAFKAANPKAVLEDFIRWYSPRDWVNSRLSVRMSSPGNLWQKLWCEALPVPALEQKPLFQPQNEGEKVRRADQCSTHSLSQMHTVYILNGLFESTRNGFLPAVLGVHMCV